MVSLAWFFTAPVGCLLTTERSNGYEILNGPGVLDPRACNNILELTRMTGMAFGFDGCIVTKDSRRVASLGLETVPASSG